MKNKAIGVFIGALIVTGAAGVMMVRGKKFLGIKGSQKRYTIPENKKHFNWSTIGGYPIEMIPPVKLPKSKYTTSKYTSEKNGWVRVGRDTYKLDSSISWDEIAEREREEKDRKKGYNPYAQRT